MKHKDRKSGGMTVIRHIVMFWLKDPSAENLEAARDRLLSLRGKIEGMLSIEVGIDALRSDRSCDVCLNTLFESGEALERYRTHPAHLPVQAYMHEVRSRSASADYPVDPEKPTE